MSTAATAATTYWVVIDEQCRAKGPPHPVHHCSRELRLQVYENTLSKDECGEAEGQGRGGAE